MDWLDVESIRASKGVHLTGRAIFHARGRVGRKSRPRTHLYVTVKEMPEKMVERLDAWERREVLWKEHMISKADEFGTLFPNVKFYLPQKKADTLRHNTKKTMNTHESLPLAPDTQVQAPTSV